MIKKLWHHLPKRRQKKFVQMQILILLGSIFDMASLGAVIPFLGVMSEPDPIYQNKYLYPLFQFFGFSDSSQILLPITAVFISLTIISAIVRLLVVWALVRLSFSAGADLSIKIYRHTLYQDYSIHAARNSSVVINGIITKTSIVTKGVFSPILNLINTSVTIIGIISVLIFINTAIALSAFIGFGGLYFIVMHITRNSLKENSKIIAEKSDLMVKSLQEGLEGIREVLLNNNQEFYINLYKNSDNQMRKASWKNELIIASPRFLMEAFGIGLIALFSYIATLKLGGINQFLPMLGAFVLGAQKLLPAIQKGYAAFSRLKSSKHSAMDVISLLDQPIPDYENHSSQRPKHFSKSIELRNLSFRYSKDSPWILKNINLVIPKGSVIGIVGTTGCGKSTLSDVIMGLLKPTTGELRVDDQLISIKNKKAWQANISNVPQSIYLCDGTIEENIAFGIPKEQINYLAVKKAAQQAQISEVVHGLDNGYQTLVGERGIRLSGGQRQRVGVARAFYKESEVIVFDEATSALDTETELAVMDALEGFDRELTVIMIAHRLTSLKGCDKIVKFEKNYEIQIISYEELINSNIHTGDIDVE